MEEVEKKKGFDFSKIDPKWVWWFAIGMAVLVFLGFCFPQFVGNAVGVSGGPIEVEGELASGYVFDDLGETEFWLSSIFEGGFNGMVGWLYLLPIISLILIISAGFCGRFRSALATSAAMVSAVFAVLCFAGPSLFAYGECWKAIGSDIALDWGDPGYIYLDTMEPELGAGFIVFAVFSVFSALASFSYGTNASELSVSELTEIAVLSAVAVGLQFIRIPIGATGGSINLGLVPLFMIALRHGVNKGLIAGGLIYGLITCLTDGYGLQTYPFDYLIGFGSVACLGFFSKLSFSGEKGWNPLGFLWIFLGVLLSSAVRFCGSTISSMVIYGYSLLPAAEYNVIYVFVTGAVSFAAMAALYIPLAQLNKVFPLRR